MRTSIRHSGGVNDVPYFTLRLVELRLGNVEVTGGVASLRHEISESELRDLIVAGLAALDEARVRKEYDEGRLTEEMFRKAMGELERKDYAATLHKGNEP